MNLLASYDWLREYVDLKETPEEFAARVSLSGPGVERLYPQGKDLEKIIVGQIKAISAHPQADKLRVVSVDAGMEKPLSIVCGGSNIQEGQWVAVALVGAKVKWHGEGDPIELKPTEIRGVASEGMICAANEIGLFDAFPHAEREILDLGAALSDMEMKAGKPLAGLLGLSGDVVMDIEITSNRPDAMGMVGLAREASAILDAPFLWKPAKKIPAQAKGKGGLHVKVEKKELCPRFMAVQIDGVTIRPSPWWLKRRLLSAGIRPINNVVDITNYLMLELGQPMHVYDTATLRGNGLTVRMAKSGETLAALDGKEYELDDSMLVIADAERPVAVAGVMGGEKTGATSATTSVILEAATFDPVSVRRTARKLNLYSDAQSRFEKGLSTEAPPLALARAVELALALTGGRLSSELVDIQVKKYKPLSFSITLGEIQQLIGVPIKQKEAVSILKRLGFTLRATGDKLQAETPWWRDHDIESGRDLVEEVARVYGYENIPPLFPAGLATRPVSSELVWEDRLKTIAKGAGLTEAYTYSFVSRALLERANFDPSKMVRVQNPLSADFEFMRTSLLPSLLQVVSENQERENNLRLFEIAHVYYHHDPAIVDWSELPDERLQLAAAFVGGDQAWKIAKGFAEHVYRECGIEEVTWQRPEGDGFWHPGRTVQAFLGEHLLGTIGEVHPLVAERFKITDRVAMLDMPLEEIFECAREAKKYRPIPAFPEAKRDAAFLVEQVTEVGKMQLAMKEISSYLRDVEWFDTYRGTGIPADKKSVAFHLTFSAPDRTLEAAEVDQAMEKIKMALKERFGAEVRA
jgi:phenylalanyl-tRNA synthetase beta chain